MIAAICGDKESMIKGRDGFKQGVVTKGKYENTLRSYQRMKDELTNEKRELAESCTQTQILKNDMLFRPNPAMFPNPAILPMHQAFAASCRTSDIVHL
jgi:hypothetical protein